MKKSVLLLTAAALSVSLFTGCSKSSNVPPNTEVVTEVSTTAQMTTEAVTTEVATTPAPHTHTYTETITTEAACVAEGVKTYSCECGDSYTETIPATGHTYGTYTYNDDATYTYDGTESAACLSCGHSDVRVAAGTMLSYTYTDMDATMYAQQTVNVRNLPNADGEKLGSLSANDEVNVTGQCTETSWYRIEYSGNVAYVSNDYLGESKIEPSTTDNNSTSSTTSATNDFPYELLTRYVTPDGKISYFYCTEDCGPKTHGWHQVWYTCNNYNNVTFGHETVPGESYETTMATFTICDDMNGYIQAATENGLIARTSVETPWKTADGKKIRAFCP